ncbi:MAG: type ISP restriction/modification enzyme [Thermoanaerobaculia bacterium]
MPPKRDVLEQLKRDELLAAVDRFELGVRDRRVRSGLVEALARSRKAGLADVLIELPRTRLKEICRALSLDDSGREKEVIIARLTGQAELSKREPSAVPAPRKAKPVQASRGFNVTEGLSSAVSAFGLEAKAKLANLAATGEPEDQLRAPLENLIARLAEILGIPRTVVTAVGESRLTHLKTRPDYAIIVRNALIGFVEIKAPGKGADPRRFRERHDKEQWEKLLSLPNLLYTDGNEFSLWKNGQLQGSLLRLSGNIETAGAKLAGPPGLLSLFEDFFQWTPIPPRDAKELAGISARLCRLLREEVTEQLALGSRALTDLAKDWRNLLFPDASDAQFADGYAQAVTFGLLMARARDIQLSRGLDQVARQLSQTNSLIGSALRLLTDDAENQATLTTSLGTLTRVLDAVHWPTISKGNPDAWLYFYEDFLEVYDNDLRKKTGSYYTPPEVVGAMIRLVDEALRSRFALSAGLASPAVTVADPAVGTGTFLLGTFRRIAETVRADEGAGAVAGAIHAAIRRVVAFEIQLGPFAVAQLRTLAELSDLIGAAPATPLRMFVTDALSNPYLEQEWIPSLYGPIAESRRQANEIKKQEPITVVIGNPPYKEKAKGLGGWIESGGANSPERAPLSTWMPPPEWGVGAHAKHLRNLYVYFWRWATWKVFDHDLRSNTGIVCFITVAGFLNGPGFEKMRDYLRRTTDEIWVIDCSPEGHQPEVNTRIFEGVQQPVCIVLASRPPGTSPEIPATVRFRALPAGHRQGKFAALSHLTLDSKGWADCPSDWRAPFLPESKGAWSTYPELADLFVYNGSGVMPGRTWVIAPDADSLRHRWQKLVDAPSLQKEDLFHPHLLDGQPGDRHIHKILEKGLPGYESRPAPIAADRDPCIAPRRYGFRSFDRQWIIPDSRLINRPNPELWESSSELQVYLTAPADRSPSAGPAVTFTGLIPDLHHYNGRGGRVFPLWRDPKATRPNISPSLLKYFGQRYGKSVTADDLMAYVAAVVAQPAFTIRFQTDLIQPGLRIPLTADGEIFTAAADLGRTVIWLHTFGERFVDPGHGRPVGPPRLPLSDAPRIPATGAISENPAAMPDTIDYDPAKRRLLVGRGFVEGVAPEVWSYEVSGKQVLRQWFSYRKADRDRPIIGDRRQPSKLGDIQPDHWLAEYTTELLNVLNVLGRLVALEPSQADLLEQIYSGQTISIAELRAAGALTVPAPLRRTTTAHSSRQTSLLE